jgi:hypothetical protein
MNEVDFERFMSGRFSFSMPYQDYLNIIQDEDKKEKTSELFRSFINSMEFAANLYGYNQPLPPIYADPFSKIVARATTEKITISQGLISHIFTIYDDVQVFDVDGFNISSETLVHLAAFWIIAHEFYHVARGHFSLFNEYYSEYAIAFEYDADCLASAALYRYIQNVVAPWSSQITRKKLAAYVVFMCSRTLLGKTESNGFGNKTHPPFVDRLAYCIMKLISLDVPHPNFGLTEEFSRESEVVIKFIVDIELQFIEIKKKKIAECFIFSGTMTIHISSALLDHFIMRASYELEDFLLEAKWEKIAPFVEKASMLSTLPNHYI